MIFVDSNILLDIITNDPMWCDWSLAQLDAASLLGPLCINDVVYAEISVRYDRIEDLDEMLAETGLRIEPIPREALFLAAKVFAQYRKSGGTRGGVLPDFFIGAHAAVSGLSLLTRDTKRFRTYFRSVTLIGPQES
ncbi:type II toxin-antitoxin system VapC family toxin [Rhizobium freirei]|nr:type II toxin-antitoxin system VapC family toxin [Rhizobium freirei]